MQEQAPVRTRRTFRRRAGIAAAAIALSATVIAGTATPASATDLTDSLGNSLHCKWKGIGKHRVAQICANVYVSPIPDSGDAYVGGSSDITVYKESHGTLTRDDTVLVSNDQTSFFTNGQSTPSTYPTGPLAGHAAGGNRIPQMASDHEGQEAYTQAVVGLWKDGQEVMTWTVRSNTVTLPVT